jgi:aspartyl/asparaginyl beta-hydroxylase (cupin superfamily)
MVYDNAKFLLKKAIDSNYDSFKQEFINNHPNISDAPLYDTGKELDIHKKWKMIPIKMMGEWEYNNKIQHPILSKFLESFGDSCRSAGYSILDPTGVVTTHTDTEENHERYMIIHFPLIVPPGDVGFYENDIAGTWSEGDSFILDVESPHSIWNNTDNPRVVILIEMLKEVAYAI